MPIYEFYCPECHMIFNFFSKSVNTEKKPICPRCRKNRLNRYMSAFVTPRNRGEEDDNNNMPLPDLDETKMEKAMNLLAKESENMDEDDPRQAANMMRKLTDMTGLTLGSGMQEALNRLESGEDPDEIEKEMGDILEEEEPFAMKKKSLKVSKYLAPRVDEKLYDL